MNADSYTPPTEEELEGVAHTRLLCPLESCAWFLVQEEPDPKDVAADALLRIRRGDVDGAVQAASAAATDLADWRTEQRVLAHLRGHDPMEWVRELTSLRARLTAALKAATTVAEATHPLANPAIDGDEGYHGPYGEEYAEDDTATEPMWNGIPTPATRGSGVVLDSPAFPQFWALHLVGCRIAVVRVEREGREPIYLDNREGDGWWKVTHGGGPGIAHADLDVAGFALEGEEPEDEVELCECKTEVAVTRDGDEVPLGEDCLRELQQSGDGA